MDNVSNVQSTVSERKNEGTGENIVEERNKDPVRVRMWNQLIQKNLQPATWRQKKLNTMAKKDIGTDINEEVQLEKLTVKAENKIDTSSQGEPIRTKGKHGQEKNQSEEAQQTNRVRRRYRRRCRYNWNKNQKLEKDVPQEERQKERQVKEEESVYTGQIFEEKEKRNQRKICLGPRYYQELEHIMEIENLENTIAQDPDLSHKETHEWYEENVDIIEAMEEENRVQLKEYYRDVRSYMFRPYWKNGKFDKEQYFGVLQELFEEMDKNKIPLNNNSTRNSSICAETPKKKVPEVSKEDIMNTFQASLNRKKCTV